MDHWAAARRASKSYIRRQMVKHALAAGRRVTIATFDVERTVAETVQDTPGTLCTVEGDDMKFVTPHRRKPPNNGE